MKFFKQEKRYTCGSASYRMILSDWVTLSEKEAANEVNTGRKGTYSSAVFSALKKRKFDANMVFLNVDFEEYSRWLYLNSFKRNLYLGCEFINKAMGKRGRNSHRHHAVAVHDGYVYDPGEKEPVPIEAYFDTYNKQLRIKTMIMVDCE